MHTNSSSSSRGRRRPAAAVVTLLCLAVAIFGSAAHASAGSDGAAPAVACTGQCPLGGPYDDNDYDEENNKPKKKKKRKNIVVILTDDQDLTMGSAEYMPLLKEHIVQKGITYRNHFTSTAICCPSRVSLWTGKLPHNTNVTDVSPPHGGYPKFVARGLNENYLPVWLQAAGYATYYVGKLFNAHNTRNYASPYPAGWTGSDFLLDPGTYSYLNPIFQRGTEEPVHHKNEHTAELTAAKALGFLEDALAARQKEGEGEGEDAEEKPFFLAVAPIAPHSNIERKGGSSKGSTSTPLMTEPIPLPRHEKLFDGVQIPRTENFNPDKPSSVSWVSRLPRFNDSSVAYLDHFYRQRLRSLQSVDELVESIVHKLQVTGALEDTYIIYSSDNGYHIGQHRLPPGKECAFEEDIRVPLYIRGPGVKEGYEEKGVTGHVDLAPTVLEMAGVEMREDFDGRPVPIVRAQGPGAATATAAASADEKTELAERRRQEHAAVEFWGIALAEGESGGFDGEGKLGMPDNTYKALRVLGDDYDMLYSVWCNNEHELYDIKYDAGQVRNLYPKNPPFRGKPGDAIDPDIGYPVNDSKRRQVINRLDALMMVLKSCRGSSCTHPWSVLHPDDEGVRTLSDALDARFDTFYEQQAKVSFSRCDLGYLIDAEGPQEVQQWREGGEYTVWPDWT
ncbi:alkaline-phosphatase-like protein [Microdochium bolleyi]|uniref:Alkaline-phosphatase-like protein n=1 Tax=Microdochium bolleyi TaxID=196109 RepID=A0A136J2B9_9PEZI|nr:alkaline-phosphatase-like protein [Microdochium bolleyi]